MKKFLLAVVVLAGVGGAYWFANKGEAAGSPAPARFGGPPSAVPVTVEVVQSREFTDRVEAIGSARANESVTITAKVTDKISQINFADGQSVKKGDLLVELTNDEQAAQLAEAKADLNEARLQLKRVENLAVQGTIAASQVDEIRARSNIANARLEGIVARLRDRVIRAPFSGVLGFRQVSPGALVTPGTAIATLDDVSTLKLDFDVPEMFLGVVNVGDPVLAASPAYRDKTFVGTVAGIESRVDEVTRSVTVRAELPNESGELRPGMLLTVELQTAATNSLSVPEASVVPAGKESYVFVINDDNVAQKRIVETGQRSQGNIEVLNGLSLGERVVVLGLVKMRDGSTVSVTQPKGV